MVWQQQRGLNTAPTAIKILLNEPVDVMENWFANVVLIVPKKGAYDLSKFIHGVVLYSCICGLAVTHKSTGPALTVI